VHAFVQDRDSSERRAPSPSKEMSKRPGNGKCPCPCESLELNSMRWSKFDPLYKLLGWSKNVFIPKIQFGTTVSLFSFPIRGSHHATSSSPSPPQIGKKLGGRRARHAPCTPPSWRAATGRVPICVGPTWTPEGAAAARLVWTPEGAAAARLVILLVVSSSWHEDRLAQEEKRERLWS
jgi:hypothetical protein